VDKRHTPRFKLDTSRDDAADVVLILPRGEQRGALLDISSGGFQVRIAHLPQPPAGGTAVTWQVRHGDLQAGGSGRFTRVDTRLDHSATLGIAVDLRLSPDRDASFAALSRQLAGGEESGAVRGYTDKGGRAVVEILGKLNPRLNRDFTNLLRNRPQRVDLSKCQQIDSGGLGLLLLGMERGVQVEGCRGLVKELVETAGICQRCASQERCWDGRRSQPLRSSAGLRL